MTCQSEIRTAGSRIKKQKKAAGGSKIAATTGNINFRLVRLDMAASLRPASPYTQ